MEYVARSFQEINPEEMRKCMSRDGTDVKAEGQDARNTVLCNEDLDVRLYGSYFGF